MPPRFRVLVILVFLLLGFIPRAEAGGKIVLQDQGGAARMNQEQMNDLARELGLTASAIPLAPSDPLGLVLGLDVGLGVSVADIRDEEQFWKKAVEDGKPKPILVLPQLSVRKGLPLGIDLGATYTPSVLGGDFYLIGGDLKWSFLKGSLATPALALRVDYHRAFQTSGFTLQTVTPDLSISKGFGLIKPYVGVGMAFIFFQPDAPSSEGGDLEAAELRELKGFAGVRVKLGFIQIVPEIDLAKNFLIYSLKLGLIL